MLLAVSRPAGAGEEDQSSRRITPEAACGEIRTSLSGIAKAERAQALALDLVAEGASTAVVEAPLSELLERTNELRTTLRRVRLNTAESDQSVELCTKAGFRSLVEAERLSTDVEEVLYGPRANPLAAIGEPEEFGGVPALRPGESRRGSPNPTR